MGPKCAKKISPTKVSTPLSENVQIGPKVSIFCVATIIFQQIVEEHDV